jgi:phosphoenolpyruvate carboxylase
VRQGLYFFRESLFEAVPQVYRFLEKAVRRVYGPQCGIKVPSFIRFGSWIGGDRDGNPFVKPETTELAVRMHGELVMELYLERIRKLHRMLSHASSICQPSPAFMDSLDADEDYWVDTMGQSLRRYVHEPYRRKLAMMDHRLSANLERIRARMAGGTTRPDRMGTTSERDFLADLHLIRDSLHHHGDASAAAGPLQDLIRLAETFGFHLVHLDIRQESIRHTEAVTELFARQAGAPYYQAFDEEQRLMALAEAIAHPHPFVIDKATLTPETRETLEVFEVMARMRAEISENLFGQYVISMTHYASHVMEVMLLGAACRIGRQGSPGLVLQDPDLALVRDHRRPESDRRGHGPAVRDPTYSALLKASGISRK